MAAMFTSAPLGEADALAPSIHLWLSLHVMLAVSSAD
jgi:hypothetical protein